MTLRELLAAVGIDLSNREKSVHVDFTNFILPLIDKEVLGSSQEFGDPITGIDFDEDKDAWQLHE